MHSMTKCIFSGNFSLCSAVFWVTGHFLQCRLKTELFERSYNWHHTCQTTLLLHDSLWPSHSFLLWPQPWSLSTIMLLWHSFLIIIIIIINHKSKSELLNARLLNSELHCGTMLYLVNSSWTDWRYWNTRQMRTTHGHLMLCSKSYIIDLPALRTVPFVHMNKSMFTQEWTRPHWWCQPWWCCDWTDIRTYRYSPVHSLLGINSSIFRLK